MLKEVQHTILEWKSTQMAMHPQLAAFRESPKLHRLQGMHMSNTWDHAWHEHWTATKQVSALNIQSSYEVCRLRRGFWSQLHCAQLTLLRSPQEKT